MLDQKLNSKSHRSAPQDL